MKTLDSRPTRIANELYDEIKKFQAQMYNKGIKLSFAGASRAYLNNIKTKERTKVEFKMRGIRL